MTAAVLPLSGPEEAILAAGHIVVVCLLSVILLQQRRRRQRAMVQLDRLLLAVRAIDPLPAPVSGEDRERRIIKLHQRGAEHPATSTLRAD